MRRYDTGTGYRSDTSSFTRKHVPVPTGDVSLVYMVMLMNRWHEMARSDVAVFQCSAKRSNGDSTATSYNKYPDKMSYGI